MPAFFVVKIGTFASAKIFLWVALLQLTTVRKRQE